MNQVHFPFCRDDVEFRWSGNKVFLPGMQKDTVRNVYLKYMTGEVSTYYGTNDHSNKGKKNQLQMALELYIDKPQVRDEKLL